jgi:hypothetical protein
MGLEVVLTYSLRFTKYDDRFWENSLIVLLPLCCLFFNLFPSSQAQPSLVLANQHKMTEYFSIRHSVLRARNHLTMGLKLIFGAQTTRIPHPSYEVAKYHQVLPE